MSGKIMIVGLGPGPVEMVTQEVWEWLAGPGLVYFRTEQHPVYTHLATQRTIHTFDHLYEQLDSFDDVYTAITQEIIQHANTGESVIYAVPGDPFVGEASVAMLMKSAEEMSIEAQVLHGISFIEACLGQIGYDALSGLTIADAEELRGRYHPPFPPDMPALIGQMYSKMVAADIKLTLLNQYPAEHEVIMIREAGSPGSSTTRLQLLEIDRQSEYDHTTSLFIPSIRQASAFESFQETVAHLRSPEGCPWDREQTHASLRPHVMEEAYETIEAIDANDLDALKEELGDLLLQIVLQAQIATEEGEFTMADIIAGIQDKLIRRHPHVFGDTDVDDVDEVLHRWEALKESERIVNNGGKGLLDGVPITFPALAQAYEIQSRVVRVGFDWPSIAGVREKIMEELEEVEQTSEPAQTEDEIGDLLFAVVNYARWKEVDPEAALREANRRFRQRFSDLEAKVVQRGQLLSELSLDEMEEIWEEVKGK